MWGWLIITYCKYHVDRMMSLVRQQPDYVVCHSYLRLTLRPCVLENKWWQRFIQHGQAHMTPTQMHGWYKGEHDIYPNKYIICHRDCHSHISCAQVQTIFILIITNVLTRHILQYAALWRAIHLQVNHLVSANVSSIRMCAFHETCYVTMLI
jgi:hypothetical protein